MDRIGPRGGAPESSGMEYKVYHERAHAAAKEDDAGNHEEAGRIYHELLQSDISDLDKSFMCNNLAVVANKMGLKDDALRWFDAGIEYERPYMRFTVTEGKAGHLYNNGDPEGALALYDWLLEQPFLIEHDKERIHGYAVAIRHRRT